MYVGLKHIVQAPDKQKGAAKRSVKGFLWENISEPTASAEKPM